MIEFVTVCGGASCLAFVLIAAVLVSGRLRTRQVQARGNASAERLASALDLPYLAHDRKKRAWFGGERDGVRFALAYPVGRAGIGSDGHSAPMLWLVCETKASAPVGYKAASNRTIHEGQSFEQGFYCRELDRIPGPVRDALRTFALEVGGVQINDLERLGDWRPPGDFVRSAAVVIHSDLGDDQDSEEVRARMKRLAAVAGVVR